MERQTCGIAQKEMPPILGAVDFSDGGERIFSDVPRAAEYYLLLSVNIYRG